MAGQYPPSSEYIRIHRTSPWRSGVMIGAFVLSSIMKHHLLYEAHELPVLQNTTFPCKDDALHSDCGEMQLVQDCETGLVRNLTFDPTKLKYDENYQNEQSFSPRFQLHLNEVQSIVQRHFSRKSLLEIGCGKGVFLNRLLEEGLDVVGLDPAYDGPDDSVIKEFFEPALGLGAEAFILRHVLEHIEDPVEFLRTIASANQNQGLIYIEVPCFDWICTHRAWFDIFYEHVNYFRLNDFHRLFGRILQSGRLFGSQYLYVVADLATLRVLTRDDTAPLVFPENFVASRDRFRNIPFKPRAIWGAASKGVIFGIHMQQLGTPIDFAIDINPVKQGRFMPRSGLLVLSPKEALEKLPDDSEIFVMNSNYLEEIRDDINNRHDCIAIDLN